MITHDRVLRALGLFYITLGILAFFRSYYYAYPEQVYWACYIAIILIGVALLRRDGDLLFVQALILTIPFVVWIIDFVYLILAHQPLWGITDYMLHGDTLATFISLQHLYTLPVIFYGLSRLTVKKTALGLLCLALLEVFLIFGATRAFTPAALNVNCAFSSCITFLTFTEYYVLAWIGLQVAFIGITCALLYPLFSSQK